MQLTDLIITPWITTLLLVVGITGIGIQLFSPRLGLSGIISLIAFAIYFYGNYGAGSNGIQPILFFVIGMILLFVEIFIPSMGILGILGFLGVISGVILASNDRPQAAVSLLIAMILSFIIVAMVVKTLKLKGIWNRFILSDEQKNELGYTSTSSKDYLLSKKGVSVTPLRPSGVAMIEDERVNVVTSGEFIPVRKHIKVIKIEGTKVIVRELHSLD